MEVLPPALQERIAADAESPFRTGMAAAPVRSKAARPSGGEKEAVAMAGRRDAGEDAAVRVEIRRLKNREGEVRRHEQAHISAGGPYVQGGARYTYQRGPDGRSYISGGEVSIDVSPVTDDPSATIEKMQVVRRAATAPSDPSPQDRAVAAQATRIESQARAELAREGNPSAAGSSFGSDVADRYVRAAGTERIRGTLLDIVG